MEGGRTCWDFQVGYSGDTNSPTPQLVDRLVEIFVHGLSPLLVLA